MTVRRKDFSERHEAHLKRMAAPGTIDGTSRVGSPAQGKKGRRTVREAVSLFPIVPTVIVAASDAPKKIRDGADYVCDGTDDNVEVQSALDEGYSRVVLSGGAFDFSSNVTMSNAYQALEGIGPGTEIQVTGDGIVINNADFRVTIANMRLTGGTGSHIVVGGTTNIQYLTVQGIHSVNAGTHGIDSETPDIRFGIITDNFISGSGDHGIRAHKSRWTTITGNVVEGTGTEGICVDGGLYNTISANVIINAGRVGIQSYSIVSAANGNVISDNIVDLTGSNGIGIEGLYHHVVNNHIEDDGGFSAIRVAVGSQSRDTEFCVINGNTIVNPSFDGIELAFDSTNNFDCKYCDVSHNIIHNVPSNGIEIGGNDTNVYVTCDYNTIYGTSSTEAESGIWVNSYKVMCRGNLIVRFDVGIDASFENHVNLQDNHTADIGSWGIEVNSTDFAFVHDNDCEGNGIDTSSATNLDMTDNRT